MIKRILRNVVRYIPIYREVAQIRDYLAELRTEVRRLREMESIRIVDLDLERHPRYGDPDRLTYHAFQVNSQNGEDGIIHEIFRRIGTTDQTFVEVGVGNGIENNTAFLLSQGWRGFWIDGDDAFVRTIDTYETLQKAPLDSLVSYVTKENIASLFQRLDVPHEFDFFSLDIDQNTFHVWEELGEYRPRVVAVEYNASIPPDVDWQVDYRSDRTWDGSKNWGASLKAFERLGRNLGYVLVGCNFTGVNAFFIREDLATGEFVRPFTTENHYEPPRYQFGSRRAHRRTILDKISE